MSASSSSDEQHQQEQVVAARTSDDTNTKPPIERRPSLWKRIQSSFRGKERLPSNSSTTEGDNLPDMNNALADTIGRNGTKRRTQSQKRVGKLVKILPKRSETVVDLIESAGLASAEYLSIEANLELSCPIMEYVDNEAFFSRQFEGVNSKVSLNPNVDAVGEYLVHVDLLENVLKLTYITCEKRLRSEKIGLMKDKKAIFMLSDPQTTFPNLSALVAHYHCVNMPPRSIVGDYNLRLLSQCQDEDLLQSDLLSNSLANVDLMSLTSFATLCTNKAAQQGMDEVNSVFEDVFSSPNSSRPPSPGLVSSSSNTRSELGAVWSRKDIREWLEYCHLDKFKPQFMNHCINGCRLLRLGEKKLAQMGIIDKKDQALILKELSNLIDRMLKMPTDTSTMEEEEELETLSAGPLQQGVKYFPVEAQ